MPLLRRKLLPSLATTLLAFSGLTAGAAQAIEFRSLTEAAIDLNALQRAVTTDLDGTVVAFIGTVRGVTPGAAEPVTTRLEYEAYASMAETKLRQVAREMREQFRGHAHFARTEEFCALYDNPAFDAQAETLPLSEFEPMLRRLMAQPRNTIYKAPAKETP